MKQRVKGYGNSWRVIMNEKLRVSFYNDEDEQVVSADAAWYILVFVKSKSSLRELMGKYIRRHKAHRNSNCEIQIEFTDGDFKRLSIRVDNLQIPLDAIARFNLYARTDEGDMVVSFMPCCAPDASILITHVTEDHDYSKILQNFASAWLMEIESKKE